MQHGLDASQNRSWDHGTCPDRKDMYSLYEEEVAPPQLIEQKWKTTGNGGWRNAKRAHLSKAQNSLDQLPSPSETKQK